MPRVTCVCGFRVSALKVGARLESQLYRLHALHKETQKTTERNFDHTVQSMTPLINVLNYPPWFHDLMHDFILFSFFLKGMHDFIQCHIYFSEEAKESS